MKYRFTLPAQIGGIGDGRLLYDVVFVAETPAETDLGDDGEAARTFVDRTLAVARYVVAALEKKREP